MNRVENCPKYKLHISRFHKAANQNGHFTYSFMFLSPQTDLNVKSFSRPTSTLLLYNMDTVLDLADEYLFDAYHVYPESWENGYWARQLLSLFLITISSGILVYIFSAAFNYYFLFDHRLERHPLFLKVCVKEIQAYVSVKVFVQ